MARGTLLVDWPLSSPSKFSPVRNCCGQMQRNKISGTSFFGNKVRPISKCISSSCGWLVSLLALILYIPTPSYTGLILYVPTPSYTSNVEWCTCLPSSHVAHHVKLPANSWPRQCQAGTIYNDAEQCDTVLPSLWAGVTAIPPCNNPKQHNSWDGLRDALLPCNPHVAYFVPSSLQLYITTMLYSILY